MRTAKRSQVGVTSGEYLNREIDVRYLVNLTNNVAGGHVLIGMRSLRNSPCEDIVRTLGRIIGAGVRDMNAETMGRICAYGSADGIHKFQPGSPVPEFICGTGLVHMSPFFSLD